MKSAKILVVDDDSYMTGTLKELLNNIGYQVIIAHNGRDALDKVAEEKPDLIILDLSFPDGIQGNEVRSILKSNRETKEIPILILSIDPDVVAGLERGADDYLKKDNLNLEELKARVNAWLRRAPLPFKTNSSCLSLRIFCNPQHPLNARISGMLSNSTSSKLPLNFNIEKYARKANDVDQNNWRFTCKDVGEGLYGEIFDDHKEISKIYNQALGTLTAQSDLHIYFESDRNFLQVPLEFLFGDNNYLVLKHPLVRTVRDVTVKKSILSADFFNDLYKNENSLKILLIASNTGGIPGVDREIEMVGNLTTALFEDKGIKVEIKSILTKEASFLKVKEELRKPKYHIIHYAGHASHNLESPERSLLYFWEKQNCEGRILEMPITELQIKLETSEVRFLYLSCCKGTVSSESQKLLDYDFLGIADGLVHANVPSVLGFRWPVSDVGAIKLAKTFYKSLAENGEIDIALFEARREIAGEDRDDITWLSPILIIQK